MSIELPRSVSVAAQWQQSDWLDRSYTSLPAVGGVATIEMPQLGDDELWLVDHMVAQCSSSTATTMRLYVSSAAPGFLRDGTNSGNFDVADWPNGLLVRPSSFLVAQWTGCSNGAVATLTLQVRSMRR